jgi:MYXO-CTERM domain-containing protein
MEPDSTPPKVLKVYPEDGAVKQPVSTRVTIFFTDDLDIDSVTSSTLVVRKNGGAPLPGVFSRSSFNAISFGSKQPLEANSTYEVIVKAGGVKDLAGNAIADEAVVRFSTGDALEAASDAGTGSSGPIDDASGGGEGGSAGAAGGEVAGAGGDGTGGAAGGGLGGSPSTGGNMSTGVAGGGTSADAPGCSCGVPGGPARSGARLWIAALLMAAVQGLRRRRS